MTTAERIGAVALDNGWTAHQGAVGYVTVTYRRGNDAVDIRYTRAGAVAYALLAIDGIARDVIGATDTDKADTVMGWLHMGRPATDALTGRAGRIVARSGDLVMFMPASGNPGGRAYWYPHSRIDVKGL